MRILFAAWVTLCFSSAMYAQCNDFFPLKENVRYEYDHFDRKEKLSFRMTHTFKNISGSGGNMSANDWKIERLEDS